MTILTGRQCEGLDSKDIYDVIKAVNRCSILLRLKEMRGREGLKMEDMIIKK